MINKEKKIQTNMTVHAMVESIVGCKWSLTVLSLIRQGINRPGAMQREVEGLTTKVLNERLVKLTRFGIVKKHIYPESPPRVEYQFTDFGQHFLQIIDSIEKVQAELADPSLSSK
ncbi:transcriptional regulator [Bowmanella pacifica]|uniref:Transcriptional regulator n=2 Tax=Bowmanella pacifica TaxID=502051 RepID=A0A917YW67_9ALTE|nr:transcriptional regulator [Bowmanella pacifica]